MKSDASKELQKEMVEVLTAISIVSKRLAARLIEQGEIDQKRENQSNHCNKEYRS
jgi:hypothetical protein